MFDDPLSKGSRLPESSRISSLLAGLMGSPAAPSPASAPTIDPIIEAPAVPPLKTQELFEPPQAQAPKTTQGRPVSAFLKSIQWSYVPSVNELVLATPGMPVREFFAIINWSGDTNPATMTLGGSIAPPSVENLMSQFSWD